MIYLKEIIIKFQKEILIQVNPYKNNDTYFPKYLINYLLETNQVYKSKFPKRRKKQN